ncbi:hypothetical protein M8818_001017 [Zalaria obscura]|uniref:Uncharacterized protein n=1 Tax=Zalaria obscura TaxID=2024903 RepID=A0ACC3SLL2_9PEZI
MSPYNYSSGYDRLPPSAGFRALRGPDRGALNALQARIDQGFGGVPHFGRTRPRDGGGLGLLRDRLNRGFY